MKLKNIIYASLKTKVFKRCVIRGSRYRNISDEKDIIDFQIKQFNLIWKDAYENIPFYSEWKNIHNLPDKIVRLSELSNWPILTRKAIQENKKKFTRKFEPTSLILTGGSTGEPLQLPSIEDSENSPSMWLGRAAYGIEPGMKTFLLWGHKHLYGKGISRKINIIIRRIKDWLSNMERVSAYDLSKEAMTKAYKKYNKYAPEFVIGFSPAILTFVRINKNINKDLPSPKAVLCTAAPLNTNELNEIQTFFNAPVMMEYGSVECGVMAYTKPPYGEYTVFWDIFLIQGVYDCFKEVKNIVTKLTNCYVPLIRYDIGDYLELQPNTNLDSILRIKAIKGRTNNIIRLDDGTVFFTAIIGDCVKQIDSVISNQLHVFKNEFRIDLVALQTLKNTDYSLLKDRLTTVIPQLKNYNFSITQVDHLYKTAGGKTPLVVFHD